MAAAVSTVVDLEVAVSMVVVVSAGTVDPSTEVPAHFMAVVVSMAVRCAEALARSTVVVGAAAMDAALVVTDAASVAAMAVVGTDAAGVGAADSGAILAGLGAGDSGLGKKRQLC